MNYLHILTLIFVVCKIAEVGVIAHWSWWLVLAPSLVSMSITLLILAFVFVVALLSN